MDNNRFDMNINNNHLDNKDNISTRIEENNKSEETNLFLPLQAENYLNVKLYY